MVFEGLASLVIVCGALFGKNKAKNKKAYIIIMCVAFSIISGFRSYKVGTDTPGYAEAFLNAPPLSFSSLVEIFSKREPFFYLLQALVREITSEYWMFFLLTSTFFISVLGCFIYKYSKIPAISFLLFMSMGYFSFSMAGIRQTIAMSFLIIALDKLINGKKIGSFINILIATMFHIVSLIFVVIYFVKKTPLNIWYILLIGIISFLFSMYSDVVVETMVEIVWQGERNYGDTSGGVSTFVLLALITVATFVFYPNVFRSQKALLLNCEVEKDIFFLKLLLVSIAFQVLAIFQANAFRLSMIFQLPLMALLPNVLNYQKGKSLFFANFVVVVALLIQLFVFTVGVADILPYTFFWQVTL